MMCTVFFMEKGALKMNVVRQRQLCHGDIHGCAARLNINERAKFPHRELEKAPSDPDMYFEEKSLDLKNMSPSPEPSFVDDTDAAAAKIRDDVKQHLARFPEDGHHLGHTVMNPDM